MKKKDFDINCHCGYALDWDKDKKIMSLFSQDYDPVKIHFKMNNWNCQDCPKTFETLKGILIHISKIHRSKKLK